MTFTDPIVGGQGTLVRQEIKSENFVAGVSGWIIRRDGSFELGPGGVIRGSVVVNGADGSIVEILPSDGGSVLITPETAVNVVYHDPAEFFAGYAPAFGGYTFVNIATASMTDNGNLVTTGQLILYSSVGNGTAFPGQNVAGPALQTTANMYVGGEIVVGGNLSNEADGMLYLRGQRGTETVTFAAATSNTVAVVFPVAFPAGVTPNVHVNINSGAGSTRWWYAKSINASNTGFTLLTATTDAARAAEAWAAIPVAWTAIID